MEVPNTPVEKIEGEIGRVEKIKIAVEKVADYFKERMSLEKVLERIGENPYIENLEGRF